MAVVARSTNKERERRGGSLPSDLPGYHRPKAAVGRRSIQRSDFKNIVSVFSSSLDKKYKQTREWGSEILVLTGEKTLMAF